MRSRKQYPYISKDLGRWTMVDSELLIANSGRAIPSDAAIDEHGLPTRGSQKDSNKAVSNLRSHED